MRTSTSSPPWAPVVSKPLDLNSITLPAFPGLQLDEDHRLFSLCSRTRRLTQELSPHPIHSAAWRALVLQPSLSLQTQLEPYFLFISPLSSCGGEAHSQCDREKGSHRPAEGLYRKAEALGKTGQVFRFVWTAVFGLLSLWGCFVALPL